MRRGAITTEDQEFTETWENIAASQNAIIRLDPRGEERPEVIVGRGHFFITTEERLITQDRVVDTKLDPFTNGDFRPVVTPDSITVESNPNALSDEELTKVLGSSDLAWSEWMKTIDSVATLRRLAEMAEGDTVDISMKRFRQLEARMAEVHPRTRIATKDPKLSDFLNNAPTPSARTQGGRSADYR